MKAPFTHLTLLALIALFAVGCGGSYQARNVDLKPTLVDASILKKGEGDQALYRYMKPDIQPGSYSKLIIDPVVVNKAGKLSDKQREEFQKLANNAYTFLAREMGKDFTLVAEPGPGTARIQMAILDADSSSPVRNILTSLSPVGIGINLITYAATGSQSGVGDITVEFKTTDAQTGDLLAAALDKRVGGKNPEGTFDTWANANAALEYWAKRIRFVACDMRKGANCEKP